MGKFEDAIRFIRDTHFTIDLVNLPQSMTTLYVFVHAAVERLGAGNLSVFTQNSVQG
jgi:hypothetical protein